MEHLKLLDQRDKEKAKQVQDKVLQERIICDAQVKKLEHKKRKEARENL